MIPDLSTLIDDFRSESWVVIIRNGASLTHQSMCKFKSRCLLEKPRKRARVSLMSSNAGYTSIYNHSQSISRQFHTNT